MKMMRNKVFLFIMTVMVFCFVVFPTDTYAGGTVSEIKAQITSVYQKSRSSFGGSFSGYCGAYVAWQLYHMGITASYSPRDGKDTFDNYKNSSQSTGGYKITAYPSSGYTLKSALNTITANGTKNAYNILIGLERGNTSASQTAGHAAFVHAIIDGVVYFSESSSLKIKGVTYPEGSVLSCDINYFCDYIYMYNNGYAPVFDGIIHFTKETTTTPTPTTPSAYVWPIEGQIFGRGFSSTHEAIDIVAPTGTAVKSINNGTVFCASTVSTSAEFTCTNCKGKGAGYHVAINYAGGIKVMYAHLNSVSVAIGQNVYAGQQIGTVGSTGNSTGPHLHLAMFLNGFTDSYAVDPLHYLTPFSNVYVSEITDTSATIHGTFGAYGPTMTAAGIYIGTNPNNMTKITETLNTDGYDSNGLAIQGILYNTAKWYGTLQPGTTYYYRVWISRFGSEYVSEIKSFKTTGTAVTVRPVVTAPPSIDLVPYVQEIKSCDYRVSIPANYRLTCYASDSATTPSDRYISAKTEAYTIACDQQLVFSDGSIRYRFTSGDGYVLYFVYDASIMSVVTNHDYDVAERKDATCTERGYTIEKCKSCGDSSTEYVDALGHQYEGAFTIDKAATCSEEGSKSKHCTRCDAKTDEVAIPATGEHVDADGKWEFDDDTHFHTCSCSAVFDVSSHTGGKATCTKKAVCDICNQSYGSVDMFTHIEFVQSVDFHLICGDCHAVVDAEKNILYGDADNSGSVDALDAMVVLQYSVEMIDEEAINLEAADVDGNGFVDSIDAMLILQYDVSIIEKFPVEEGVVDYYCIPIGNEWKWKAYAFGNNATATNDVLSFEVVSVEVNGVKCKFTNMTIAFLLANNLISLPVYSEENAKDILTVAYIDFSNYDEINAAATEFKIIDGTTWTIWKVKIQVKITTKDGCFYETLSSNEYELKKFGYGYEVDPPWYIEREHGFNIFEKTWHDV